LPTAAPTPLPSSSPTPLPTSAPTPPPTPDNSYHFFDDDDDDDAPLSGGNCVCMSQNMVDRILENCPHVAHHFTAGCLRMTLQELQDIGETCPGLNGVYV
jgi:hypothetical protein